jgi:hypothetical protein
MQTWQTQFSPFATGRLSIWIWFFRTRSKRKEAEDKQYNIVTTILVNCYPKKWGILESCTSISAIGEEYIGTNNDPFNQDIRLQQLLTQPDEAEQRKYSCNHTIDYTKRQFFWLIIGVKQ